MIEPGPKTKGLGILILFGGGRYWSKEYQKNSRKFKICIIMHKYAKLVICSIGSLLLCCSGSNIGVIPISVTDTIILVR